MDGGMGEVVEPYSTDHPNWATDNDRFVVMDADSLSIHRFIWIGVRATPSEVLSRRAKEKPPRQWTLRKLDENALMAAVLAKSLCLPREGESIRDSVERIGAILTEASDVAMPRSRSSRRRSAY
jgi:hypothetical protein